MRAWFVSVALVAVLAVAACGGTTSAPDDAGPDVKVACFADVRTSADRSCSSNADCAVIDHVADCCGSIVEEGVRGDEVDAIHDAETEANAGCPLCQCNGKPTVDETGASGTAFVASCDTGVCTAHAQL